MATTAELDAGQRQQVQHMRELQAQGVQLGGWKLGQTSGASRDAFGVGYRAFGFVRQDRVLHSGDTLPWQRMQPGQIETELCLVLLQDLVPSNNIPVSAAQARQAVLLAPGFELNQSRMALEASHPDRIADNLSNWGIVVGEPQPIPQQWQPQQLEVAIAQDGVEVNRVAAAGHIDDHFESLALLANRLAAFGCELRAGDLVITGAYGRIKEPAAGVWTGDFGVLGSVTLTITRD